MALHSCNSSNGELNPILWLWSGIDHSKVANSTTQNSVAVCQNAMQFLACGLKCVMHMLRENYGTSVKCFLGIHQMFITFLWKTITPFLGSSLSVWLCLWSQPVEFHEPLLLGDTGSIRRSLNKDACLFASQSHLGQKSKKPSEEFRF